MRSEICFIDTPSGRMKTILVRPRQQKNALPGILWIHGGGYTSGMADMVHISRGKDLARTYGGVVISPEYRLARKAPYPAALEDCYAALLYLWDHAEELGADKNRIVVGGESAGGGLAAAVCLYARDQGVVKIALQLPLYPMIDCEDTDSSRDNHGKVWNTKKNHRGWKNYLGTLYGQEDIPPYASPAREEDYSRLPPCYTFVADGEPFYSETLTYVRNLRAAGVEASVDIYHGDVHGFDLILPWRKESRAARKKLCQLYEEKMGKSAP